MANNVPEMSRANTMEVTAQEGQAYLDKNLTEWKKPLLMGNAVVGAKDNGTHGDQDDSQEEAPDAVDKPKLAQHTTMIETAKEGNELLAGEKLGETRSKSKRGQSEKAKRQSLVDEAKAVYSDLDLSEGRSLRKRAPPPEPAQKTPPVKKSKEATKASPRNGVKGAAAAKSPAKKSHKKKSQEEAADEEEAKTGEKGEGDAGSNAVDEEKPEAGKETAGGGEKTEEKKEDGDVEMAEEGKEGEKETGVEEAAEGEKKENCPVGGGGDKEIAPGGGDSTSS